MAGACEGTLACSTCHLIFKQANYDSMPDTPTDEELDMLDLAFDLQQTYDQSNYLSYDIPLLVMYRCKNVNVMPAF